MSQKRPAAKLLSTLLISALASVAAPAGAVTFSGVFVFGDSLSDAGTYRPGLTALLGAPTAAALGRFSTNPGPVWSEFVSSYYGFAPRPSNNNNGNIFAQGGMRVTLPSPPSLVGPGGTQRPFSTQLTEYLARGPADPNALYGVWIGANDLLVLAGTPGLTAAEQTAIVSAAATAEIQQIGRLAAAGARYILVFNIPDLGITPSSQAGGPAAIAAGTAGAVGYNATLFAGLQSAGIRVIPVDTFSLLNEIRANPNAYGFTNLTGVACLPAGSSSLTCSGANLAAPNAASTYLFADGVHPTSAAQRIVADYVISLIDGPQQLSLLAEAPLRSRESHLRTLESGLAASSAQPTGKINFFAAADGSKFELDASGVNPQLKTDQKSITVGLSMRASESVIVGVAVGKSENDGSFGNGLGGFETDETVASAFASMKFGGLYVNGALSVADVEFSNIRRNIAIGQLVRNANASTGGANFSSSLTAGYDATFGKLTIGPFVSLTKQDVTVNAFTEAGAGTANLKIGQQDRKSSITSGGIRASFDLGNFTPFVRFSADREDANNSREVTATPAHLASGNSYVIPGYSGDNSWVTTTVGVRGRIGERIGVSLVYSSVNSREKAKQDGIAASVAFQF